MSALDFEALVSTMGDAVVVSDASGAITVWNRGAERIFGYTQAEALGKSLDIMIPERLQKRHWDGYNQTMSTGETKYGNDLLKVPAAHKDGRALSIAFTVTMLFSPDGKPEAIAAVIRDETERFSEERALRKRLADVEAQLAAKNP